MSSELFAPSLPFLSSAPVSSLVPFPVVSSWDPSPRPVHPPPPLVPPTRWLARLARSRARERWTGVVWKASDAAAKDEHVMRRRSVLCTSRTYVGMIVRNCFSITSVSPPSPMSLPSLFPSSPEIVKASLLSLPWSRCSGAVPRREPAGACVIELEVESAHGLRR